MRKKERERNTQKDRETEKGGREIPTQPNTKREASNQLKQNESEKERNGRERERDAPKTKRKDEQRRVVQVSNPFGRFDKCKHKHNCGRADGLRIFAQPVSATFIKLQGCKFAAL